ncbi:MAG: STM3941 family protein [Prolixibacteraceae bacterium]
MESRKDEINIGVSKRKALLLTLVGVGLFSISVWAFTKVVILLSGFDRTFLMAGISLLMITFGFSSVCGLKKLITNKHGLIISDQGIKINIGPNRGQFIQWSDIKEIKLHSQVRGPMYLLFFVKNPTDILKGARGFRRFLLKMNAISHKTPVSITSVWLECNLDQIIEIIEEKIKKQELCTLG